MLAGSPSTSLNVRHGTNMSGMADVDHDRSMHLVDLAVEFAAATLRPGGDLLVKVFRAGIQPLIARLAPLFALRNAQSGKPSAAAPSLRSWHAGIDWCRSIASALAAKPRPCDATDPEVNGFERFSGQEMSSCGS